jgi:hypothetical protein
MSVGVMPVRIDALSRRMPEMPCSRTTRPATFANCAMRRAGRYLVRGRPDRVATRHASGRPAATAETTAWHVGKGISPHNASASPAVLHGSRKRRLVHAMLGGFTGTPPAIPRVCSRMTSPRALGS